MQRFARACAKIEQRHGSTREKFDEASRAFAGHRFPKHKQPYQDFALLMDIRNDIMHGGDDEFPGISIIGDLLMAEPPPLAQKLSARKLALGVREGGMGSYIAWLDTADVARWACNSAALMVQSVLDIVPAPIQANPDPQPDVPSTWGVRSELRFWYGNAFGPIP